MGTQVEQSARGSHARRPLGRPCRACGSTNTWVELRREIDLSRAGAAGEWPYAVCQACGHAARGRRTQPAPQQHDSAARPPERAASAPTPEPEPDHSADRAEQTGSRTARPPRPKATDERVEQLLAAAGYNKAITAEVLQEHRRFATHAGKPGLPRWKAAVAVLNGAMGAPEVPHVREIYAEEKRRREVRRARAARIRKQAGELADEHAVAAREQVARVWAETGEGPTWRELAAAIGVKGPLASAMIDALHRRGALTSTKKPRSLSVTPEWMPPSDP